MSFQTHDRLFHVQKAKRVAAKAKPELALTPRPGEPLRWCAHDIRLLHDLLRPTVQEALSAQARAFLRELEGKPTITLEQAAWLRQVGRKVSFADVKALNGGRRAMKLDEPPSSKG